ncbi:MAG: pyridoxamine 5'-phosphate oxidase [Chloroflexaceae bacterium]
MSIADLRQEYSRQGLNEVEVDPNPLALFGTWLAEAIRAQVYEPNAMTLATVSAEGRPAARMVLLKGFDAAGFVFYTNYTSRKGQELAQTPWAALVFWWGELERQVRIEGPVTPVPAAESDAYFASRPWGSRLGALASPQSQIIDSRRQLEQRLAELQAEYAQRDPPRPAHWGGYRLAPLSIEFWKGRPNRLHDRLRYQRQDDGSWRIDRLAP